MPMRMSRCVRSCAYFECNVPFDHLQSCPHRFEGTTSTIVASTHQHRAQRTQHGHAGTEPRHARNKHTQSNIQHALEWRRLALHAWIITQYGEMRSITRRVHGMNTFTHVCVCDSHIADAAMRCVVVLYGCAVSYLPHARLGCTGSMHPFNPACAIACMVGSVACCSGV